MFILRKCVHTPLENQLGEGKKPTHKCSFLSTVSSLLLAIAHWVYIYSVSQTRASRLPLNHSLCPKNVTVWAGCNRSLAEPDREQNWSKMPKSHCCKGHCLSSLNLLDSFWMCIKKYSMCTVAGVCFSFNSYLITKSITMKTASE